MNIHEELFVKNFIVPQKRERYLEFLANEKNRYKITLRFDHCADLVDELKNQVTVSRQNAEDVYKLLKSKGAADRCHIISHDDEIDGKEMSLRKVLENHFFDNGTFISCIPGKLVYYASEEINGCYILEKR